MSEAEAPKVDVLVIMKRLDRAMAKLTPVEKILTLSYLNNKHGEPK